MKSGNVSSEGIPIPESVSIQYANSVSTPDMLANTPISVSVYAPMLAGAAFALSLNWTPCVMTLMLSITPSVTSSSRAVMLLIELSDTEPEPSFREEMFSVPPAATCS